MKLGELIEIMFLNLKELDVKVDEMWWNLIKHDKTWSMG
jgi:hypothetical protein